MQSVKYVLKKRLTRTRVVILTIVILLSSIIFLAIMVNYLIYINSRYPSGEFYDRLAAVLFSGVNKSGLVACPWVLNKTDGSVVGINYEFRDYFTEDFSAEIQNYSLLTGFEIRYTHIYHEFDHGLQTDPNHTPFDPYYVLVYIEYDSTIRSNNYLWNDKIAPALEASCREKWYISEFMIVLTIAAL